MTAARKRPIRPRPVRRRQKQERGNETRDHIIAAAIELISTKGYPAATVQNISEQAGVSRGALQHHFAARDDLFDAISERLTERLDLKLSASEFLNMSIASRIAHIVDQYWDVFRSPDYAVRVQVDLYEPKTRGKPSKKYLDFLALRQTREQEWVRIFADTSATTEQIAAARRFTHSLLRGLALGLREDMREAIIDSQLEFLRAALGQMLRAREP